MFQAFNDILQQQSGAKSKSPALRAGLIVAGFEKTATAVLGQDLSGRLKALHLAHGRLVVACLNDELIASLKARDTEIITALNCLSPGPTLVNQLYFLA